MITPARITTIDGLSGVVLLEHGVPLSLRVDAFDGVTDARDFLNWYGDGIDTEPVQLAAQAARWRRERAWPECDADGCDMRVEDGGLCSCCERDACECRERDALEAASSVECGPCSPERDHREID